ncbi:CMRF35-like molecule 1 [Sinocyclocheilus rhinocerous]|uniref:CMRF35-like molecule 1 n=1 Tax=Sinocyclocheilus rhinocerous TaxID=307959 RepID=UPI0007B9E65C|nr:PREDICTED: CMRF35-like molecule 1 [Sinocyclocheilus rhinocerous]
MAAYAKTKIFYISIGFWLILGVKSYDGWSNYVLTIQTGGSVTIPCHYDKKYTQQKKYWFSEIDKSNTYTNTTDENLSVIDHPDQSLFTVTMRNLQNKHKGHYYCVVETGEQPPINITYEPYLKIQSAPDVSVVSSSVSGHEGGDISVKCLYSSRYQNKLKQWCRYKDQSCYTVGRTDTSQNSSVQISDDDGGRSFTVLTTGLRRTDSGWYFCSVGDLQVPVQLLVQKDDKYKNTSESDDAGLFPSICRNQTASNDPEDSNCSPGNSTDQMHWIFLLYTAVPLLLLLMLVLVIWRLIKKHNGALSKRRPDVCSVAEGPMTVAYDTVVFKKAEDHVQNQVSISRPLEREEVIYSTPKLH